MSNIRSYITNLDMCLSSRALCPMMARLLVFRATVPSSSGRLSHNARHFGSEALELIDEIGIRVRQR